MGERANLVLINSDDYELYYNHWCAIELPEIVFCGPQSTMEFIQMQAVCNKNKDWLNMIWAEGGILLDFNKKNLLLFGGELLRDDIPLREVYLEILQLNWLNWNIEWAYSGICDLANYVKFPLDNLIVKRNTKTKESNIEIIINNSDGVILCTYIQNKECLNILIDGDFEDYLFSGKSFLNALNEIRNREEVQLTKWPIEFPTAGIVIDEENHRLSFWSSDSHYNLEEDLEFIWDKWIVENKLSNYRDHIEYLHDKLEITIPNFEEQALKLKDLLKRKKKTSKETLNYLLSAFKSQNVNYSLNSNIYLDQPLELGEEEKLKIIEATIQSYIKAKKDQTSHNFEFT